MPDPDFPRDRALVSRETNTNNESENTMKTNEIAVTDLRPGFVIVEHSGTKHEKTTTVRHIGTCFRRGFAHVNPTHTERNSKGGHALCFDMTSRVIVKDDEKTADVPVFRPTLTLAEE